MADDAIGPEYPLHGGKPLVASDASKKEGDRLLEALRAAKPLALQTPGALGPARVTVATASPLIEGPWGASGTQWAQSTWNKVKQEIPADPFTARSEATTEFTSTAAAKTPFLVYQRNDPDGVPILKIFPGTIATLMPTLNGARLDKPDTDPAPHPWFYPPANNFSFFLRVHLMVVTPVPVNYRSHIDEVLALTDDDPLAVPDIDPITSEIPEYFPIWEGATDAEKALHTKGHFYIKIADVTIGPDGQGHNVAKNLPTGQRIYQSYLTFVVAGDEVIVLV
jgi:hypothetical protein